MATRQTIRGRRSCLLYLGRLFYLALFVVALVAVAWFLVLPQLTGQQQQTGRLLAQARSTAEAQAEALQEAKNRGDAQATALVEAQATVEAQAAGLRQADATAEAQVAAIQAAQETIEALQAAKAGTEATIETQATDMAELRTASTATADGYAVALAAARWDAELLDPFNLNWNNWCTGNADDELLAGYRSVAGGKYRWQVQARQSFVWWCPSRVDAVADFLVSVQVQRLEGTRKGQYGIRFRAVDPDNYYQFRVRDDATFSVALRQGGRQTSLIDWTDTAVWRPGEVNRLMVLAWGAHLLFYINDRLVGQLHDDSLTEGQVGLMIQLDNPGDEIAVEFDDFEVRRPQ